MNGRNTQGKELDFEITVLLNGRRRKRKKKRQLLKLDESEQTSSMIKSLS